jgi:hypothetical protein
MAGEAGATPAEGLAAVLTAFEAGLTGALASR